MNTILCICINHFIFNQMVHLELTETLEIPLTKGLYPFLGFQIFNKVESNVEFQRRWGILGPKKTNSHYEPSIQLQIFQTVDMDFFYFFY